MISSTSICNVNQLIEKRCWIRHTYIAGTQFNFFILMNPVSVSLVNNAIAVDICQCQLVCVQQSVVHVEISGNHCCIMPGDNTIHIHIARRICSLSADTHGRNGKCGQCQHTCQYG